MNKNAFRMRGRLEWLARIGLVIWTASVIGAGWAATQLTENGSVLRLSNGHIATTFNLVSGEWEALHADGTVFASQMRCVLNTESGPSSTTNGAPSFAFFRLRHPCGQGIKVEIQRAVARPFLLVLTLYDDLPVFVVQVRVPNARGLRIREVTLPEGRLPFSAPLPSLRLMVNDPNEGGESEIQAVDLTEHRNHWETSSQFCLAVHNRADRNQVVLGALYSKGASRIDVQVNPEQDPRSLAFQARCFYSTNVLTVEDAAWESPHFVVGASPRMFSVLEAYGAVARAYRPIPVFPVPPTGWSSLAAGASVSQDRLFDNLAALKNQRLDEYGLRSIQLEDGRQPGIHGSGLWAPREDRFPAGLREVARRIQSQGLVPGLRIGPLGEDHGRTNQPQLWVRGQPGRYDLSNPLFKQYLAGEANRLVEDWGFHYLQADGLELGSTASVLVPFDISFREAILTLMNALQPHQGYLVTGPGREWLSVGFTDGQRLGNDLQGGAVGERYPALRTWSRRYFANNNFWVGHPDPLRVDQPSEEQGRLMASWAALSGGATILGDDLTGLSPSHLDLLRRTLPAQGISARPCDLFEPAPGWAPKIPRRWDCRVRKSGVGSWDVVGLFNWTTDSPGERGTWRAEPQNLILDFADDLELDPGKRYLVFDFWQQAYWGAFEKELRVGLAPGSCRVLVLREETSVPQVLGDDRHIVSGAEAWKRVFWDRSSQTLQGWIETVRSIPYALTFYVPAGMSAVRATANNQAVPVELLGPYAARLRFDTGDGKVNWMIFFRNAPARREPTANSRVNPVEVTRPSPALPEIPLGDLPPLWTDQSHDLDSGCLRSADRLKLGARAPFWLAWDISAYHATHSVLLAEAIASGDGKVFFEVRGDGRRLWASEILAPPAQVSVRTVVAGIQELQLICHDLEGRDGNARGVISRPRLARE